jgi:uncharacterized membrane protein YkoI
MNTTKLRSKRVLLPTIVAAAALVVGGVVWASTANTDDLEGGERDRVGAAATQAVGGGTVVSAESSDDVGEAYEVEVRQADGAEVDVSLDQKLDVIGIDGVQNADDRATDGPDADDRVLSPTERGSAEKAALAAVGGGTVTNVEASDDPGEAYEVDVRNADGTEWDVSLDSGFAVLHKAVDR